MSYFYSFRHRPTCANPTVHPQLLCVQANSMTEAIARAEYFGAVFDVVPECDCCTSEWHRPDHGDRMTRNPSWRARPLEYWGLSWVILYRNDNMTDRDAVPLDSELYRP